MPDNTMREAAQELHGAVLALRELIEREYPSRREVERRFVSKSGSNRRIISMVLLIIASMFFGFFSTVTTVSTCFLSGGGMSHPTVCNVLPGYRDSVEANDKILKIFDNLVKTTQRNDRRITRLEKKAD